MHDLAKPAPCDRVQTGAHLAAGYRSGAFTPTTICDQALARARLCEPALNAFIDLAEAPIRAAAQRASAAFAAGRDPGPLCGIPFAVKDIIDVAGQPTSFATRAMPAVIADRDATVVARLRAAGAIPFGKTNLLEFAFGIAHPDYGQTFNPHDPERTAGGSSGGSAAAVAAGIVPFALGTDTGGSVRAPAAYCGIVGFKPSYAALPGAGIYPLSASLDHPGILAASVADAALAFGAAAGWTNARLSARSAAPGRLSPPGAPLRIGLVSALWHHPAITAEVRLALDAALARIMAAGCTLIEVDLPPREQMDAALMDILFAEAALVHDARARSNSGGYAAQTLRQIEIGRRLPALRYLRAMAVRSDLRVGLETLMERVDLLLTPTLPFVAPDSNPALEGEGDDEILSLTHANLTGAPAISLPCPPVRGAGATGLPVGVQLTAGIGEDEKLLGAAAWLHEWIGDPDGKPHS